MLTGILHTDVILIDTILGVVMLIVIILGVVIPMVWYQWAIIKFILHQHDKKVIRFKRSSLFFATDSVEKSTIGKIEIRETWHPVFNFEFLEETIN